MQKKKLDELFQEKFSNFKETPDNSVWRSIEASLNKKQKKRMVPFWWTLGGVAALLVLGLIIVNPFQEEMGSESILVDSKEDVPKEGGAITNTSPEKEVPAISPTENQFVETETTDTTKNTTPNAEPNPKNESDLATKQGRSGSAISILAETNAVAQKSSNKNGVNSQVKMGIATENGNTAQNESNVLNSSKTTTANAYAAAEKKDTISTNTRFKNGNPETGIVAAASEQDEEIPEPSNKKSIFDEITEDEPAIAENSTKKRWSAGPSVAPVYFNAIGEGSPVNAIFSPNSKSGNVNFSYGVSVAYQVSEKLSVRSGIHKVDYGYDTNDVRFSSSMASVFNEGQLTNINYASDSKSIIVSSNEVASDKFSTANSATDVTAKSATREGFLSQQLGYLELPVELNYALVNQKFGVDLIGGFSSLFLIDNNVSLTSGDLTAEVGEANNVNEINFSANMGLGMHYKFTPKVRLNVEPVFKYQLNTFSSVDGSFNPYSIGIYSGISFKF